MRRIDPGPGQESVWDYPRPPAIEPARRRIRAVFGGEVIADSTDGHRVLETSHPPAYYIPLTDVHREFLHQVDGQRSFCEWKGVAVYWSIGVEGRRSQSAGWSYPDPSPAFAALRDHISFYAGRLDEAWVDDELVTPQTGDFYGGWITADVVGPFKGGTGTSGW